VVVCFAVIGGLPETIRLCKDCHDPRVLRALIMIVVTMVPYPDELVVSLRYGHCCLFCAVACVTQGLRAGAVNLRPKRSPHPMKRLQCMLRC
jgi:hypothetical protein